MAEMQRSSDAPLTATLGGATIPRFQDGTSNMQELPQQALGKSISLQSTNKAESLACSIIALKSVAC